MQYTEKFIEIDAPVERVFDLFSNFENFPRWMRNIKDVHYSGRHYTRWTAAAPLGSEVEWEAETTAFQPDRRIAWRSVRGDVDTQGEVIFEETRRGTTIMHVILGYDPPAGRLGAMVASLFGKNPEQQLEEDLERFALVAERRGGKAYSNRRRDDDRPARSYAGSDNRDARYEHREARDSRDDAPRRGREMSEQRSRFDEELRAARRSQIEGQRRYMEERELDERHRDRADRDERIRRASERERREIREADFHPATDAESLREERPHRYALTPRERAHERSSPREPDYGYSEKAFNRGVDKLMDDAPSNRWRR